MTLKSLMSGENGKKILIIGAAAVLILLLMSTVSRGTKTAKTVKPETVEDAAQIEQTLEQRLEKLLGKIEGVGSVSVMVTLDRCSQQVYEKDEKSQNNVKNESGSSTENSAKETEIVLAGSGKEPLQTAVVQPKVRGAAVVCSGAGDPIVREKVTNAVAKALNIGVSKVYVTN